MNNIESNSKRLLESEKLFQYLANSGQALIWVSDVDKKCFYFNKTWLNFTGRTLEQEAGDGWAEGVHPDDLARCLEIFVTAFDKREKFSMDYRIKRFDGVYRWIQDDGTPLYDDNGVFVGFIGHCLDITEHKSASEDAHRVKEYLEKLINYANAPIIVWDNDYKITRFNHAFENLSGLKEADILGEHIQILFPEYSRNESLALIQKTSIGTQWRSVEIPIQKRDGGTRIVLWNSAAIYSPDATQIVATIAQGQDITEYKLMQIEFLDLNNELEQRVEDRTAELLLYTKELESLTFSMSHDLRTPLRGIDGWSLSLKEDYSAALDPLANKYIDLIRSEIQRLGQTIDDIQELTAIIRSEFKPENTNLTRIAQSIVSKMYNKYPNRNLKFDIAPDLVAVGDANQLEILLFHLFDNACKFTSKQNDAQVSFGVNETDKGELFFIKDNGAGFDMAYSNKLFKPFQRLHKAADFPGTGTGLAIVHRIIQRHGGEISLESELDKGTTVYFSLIK